MTVAPFLKRLREFEVRVRILEHENQQLRDENATLLNYLSELETALKNKADSKTSKTPKFSLNYRVERNQPTDDDPKQKRKYHQKATGRVPNANKFENADDLVDLFPENAKKLPKIQGIRNRRSEYGSEVIVSRAFLVYWIGISIDHAGEVFKYFTGLELSKGQADSLLNQLSANTERDAFYTCSVCWGHLKFMGRVC